MIRLLGALAVMAGCMMALLPVVAYAEAAANAKAPAAASAAPAAVWTERCNKNEKAEGPKRGRCEIFQRLIVKDTGQRVVEMAVGFPKDKQNARGIVITPLGILLQPGVQMKIDDRESFKFQLRFCDTAGCFGFIDLNEKVLSAMKTGQKILLTFQAVDGKNVNVELSLKDFAKALDGISQ